MHMSKTVEFYFDLGSPATYLAYTQLPKICAETNSQLVYIPMLLGGVFKATGNASPAMIPAKGRYMFVDLDRYARRYGVPLKFNPHFPDQHPDAHARRHGHAIASARAFPGVHRLSVQSDMGGRPQALNDPATVAAVLTRTRLRSR
jgi:2-hydroxychromene-2-carboxylate isomerase